MVNCCIAQHLNNDDALWCAECGSLVTGAMIGDYRLISYVGNGSSADVYLAEQPSLNKRKVVIKILHRSWSEARVRNFQREAAALALLSHPYILPIFAYGVLYKQAEPLPYLVLPYAEQGSLDEMFARHGKRAWSLTRVVTIVKEIAEALDYAHARGVLHRDVKPANILQLGSHAVLSDFSVATSIDADISHLNLPWAGSPAYMAPEVWQLHPGRYSDQYALAVSSYYLLTAQLPWDKTGDMRSPGWANLHCFVPPRSILELRPELPSSVDVVLQHALSKDPHDRYASVQAFAADLSTASQDITKEIVAPPVQNGSREVIAQPALMGTQAYGKEQYNVQPVVMSAEARLPATSPADHAKPQFTGDVSTDRLKKVERYDKWVLCALVLNLLICLVVSAEYAWQLGNMTAAADMLLAVWPSLLCGPLLARLFRRVTYDTLSWGLFWGVFFGLTDGLISALLCFVWTTLALLPTNFHCPTWCNPGDGFVVVHQEIINIAFQSQILIPFVLSLWIAVIGGAIIGVACLPSQSQRQQPTQRHARETESHSP